MKIAIYVLNEAGGVYDAFSDVDSALRILGRQVKYLRHRTVVVFKDNIGHRWEKINDLRQLQKEINEFLFPKAV